MEHRLKALIAGLCAVLSAVLLASCGKPAPENTPTVSPTASVDIVTQEPTVTPAADVFTLEQAQEILEKSLVNDSTWKNVVFPDDFGAYNKVDEYGFQYDYIYKTTLPNKDNNMFLFVFGLYRMFGDEAVVLPDGTVIYRSDTDYDTFAVCFDRNDPVYSAPPVDISTINLIETLSDADYKKLSIFFSNFSEVHFSDFETNNYTDEQLIEFAIWHIDRNNIKEVKPVDNSEYYSSRISAAAVENTADKYFGLSVNHKSVGYVDNPAFWNYGQYTYLYQNGYYYYSGADGDPLTWSEITEFIDNGDGTFTVATREYASHSIENPYEREVLWRYDSETFWDDEKYHVALIEPYSYDGKDTYKLLRWKAAQ
ncbi:MAG: hypothetical protein LBO63_05895 [Oscillospiraceae bacterium]|nr:hypothetical protein [Oscillospiraceae bacterium]